MPTVIDELIVRLGLDPTNFNRGQKAAAQSFIKTREEAQRQAKEIEAAGQRSAQFFTKLKNEVVALFAAFGMSYGLAKFIKDTTTTEAAVGRLATNLGMSTEQLSAWQGAAQRAGGSAEGIGGSFQGLTQQFQQFTLTGQSAVIPYFRALNVEIADATGAMRPMNDIMLDLADRFSKMTPQRANAFGAAIGLDQGTINLLIQGREAVQKLLAEQQRLGVVTGEQARQGIAFNNAMLDLRQTAETLGREIFTDLEPALQAIVESLTAWVTANREWIKTNLVEDIKAGATEVRDFARAVDNTVQSMGGWVTVTEILLGLWVGAKFLAIMANVAKFAAAVRTATAAQAAVGGIGGAAGVAGRSTNLLGGILGLVLGAGGTLAESYAENTRQQEEMIRRAKEELGFEVGERSLLHPIPTFRNTKTGEEVDWAHMRERLGGPAATHVFEPTSDTEMSPAKRAFLDSLSMGESGGDYGAHNPTSSAHGRYQFIDSTDAEVSAKTGLPGQDKVSQDRKGWYLASTTYRRNTGRDLEEDVRSGGREAQIADALKNVWPSLPGGSQQNTDLPKWIRHLHDNMAAQSDQARQTNPAAPAPGSAPPASVPVPVTPAPTSSPAWMVDPSMTGGAAPAAARSSVSNDNSKTSSTNVETNINGPIQVSTNASDPDGIAKGIGRSLQRYAYVSQANTGLS